VNPGYFTDFKAFFTCSSEIDISEAYARRATGKQCARAQRGKGGSASPENASPARTDGGWDRRRRKYQAAKPRLTFASALWSRRGDRST
jgi:hypothetical protein